MKKKNIIIIIICLVSFTLLNTNKVKTESIYRKNYNVYLDGKTFNSFPTKGNYSVKVNCKNGNGHWNYDEWNLVLDDIDKDTTCSVFFNTINNSIKLSDHIVSLENVESGTGKLIHETFEDDQSYVLNGVPLNKSNYTNLTNDPTYPFNWDENNKNWNKTINEINNSSSIKFKVNKTNEYYFCYTQVTSEMYNYSTVLINNVEKFSSKNKNAKNKCINLGKIVENSDEIEVRYTMGGNDTKNDFLFYIETGELVENKVKIDTGYRYEGKDPNNYIRFNDEIWRIIGVFNTNLNTGKLEMLTKLIRENPIGAYSYGEYNVWEDIYGTKNNLNNILNIDYYNSTNGSNETYCTTNALIKTSCNFIKTGLKESSRQKIENVIWNLGGNESNQITIKELYKREISNLTCKNNKSTSIGKVGLIYISDYLFASLASSCDRSTQIMSYKNQNCAGNNWLFYYGDEWTITPNIANNGGVHTIHYNGNIGNPSSENGELVRPVLYLKSSTILKAGNGSKESPYIIE